MDRLKLQSVLEKYEHHLDASEPAYLSAIRAAFASSPHKIVSPPSKMYFDPLHKKEKSTERFVIPSHNPSSVNGWVDSVMLFVATKTEKRGRHNAYSLGAALLIDEALVLEVVHAGAADSEVHWEMKALGVALGQLWRCLRSHGIHDPRTRSVKLVCSQLAHEWLSPGQGRTRAKCSVEMRRDWTSVADEIGRWTGMRWILFRGDDSLERRATKLAQMAMK